MGIRVPLPRAVARVLVAFVVLAGLFLMHGLPAGNCGGQGAASASSMAPAVMAPEAMTPWVMVAPTVVVMPADVAVRAPAVLSSSLSGAGAVSPADAAATGAGVAVAVCVSRPPPPGLAALSALALLVAVAAVGEAVGLAGLTVRSLRSRGLRAPPQAGAALLVRLCISRT